MASWFADVLAAWLVRWRGSNSDKRQEYEIHADTPVDSACITGDYFSNADGELDKLRSVDDGVWYDGDGFTTDDCIGLPSYPTDVENPYRLPDEALGDRWEETTE